MDINTIDKKLEGLALKYGLRLRTSLSRDGELVYCTFTNDKAKMRLNRSIRISNTTKRDFDEIEDRLLDLTSQTRDNFMSEGIISGGEIMFINLVIKNVIFNDPATIVFWKDGTKTVVQAHNDEFDPEKGLAMAIAKKALGNKGNYYNKIKKWLPDEKAVNNADGKN